MNSKDQNSAKSSHLVVLLLVVGLVAFSSAMKDLSQLHQYALGAGQLIASWSHQPAPHEIPATVVKVETCELNNILEQSVPSVELPWLEDVVEEKTNEAIEVEAPHAAERSRRRVQVVRPARVPRVDFDPVQLEVRLPSDQDAEADVIIPTEFPQFSFKTKTRKHNVIRISPRDREMILKTGNRSINLRIAS
jgi:hypothetical protein